MYLLLQITIKNNKKARYVRKNNGSVCLYFSSHTVS
jgi:hypothetical protein